MNETLIKILSNKMLYMIGFGEMENVIDDS